MAASVMLEDRPDGPGAMATLVPAESLPVSGSGTPSRRPAPATGLGEISRRRVTAWRMTS